PDPAFGVGEVVLVGGTGAFPWRLGLPAPALAPGLLLLRLAGRQLGLVFGPLGLEPRLGPLFDRTLRLLELGDAVLATLDFTRDAQSVLQRGAVGLLGLGQQLADLLPGQLHLLLDAL